MAVNWAYNGSNTVSATCTGLTPSTGYTLFSTDPSSTPATGTSNGSGDLTLTIGPGSGVGGLSAGDTFAVDVEHTSGDFDPVACITLKYGTSGSTDQGIAATWAYDGGGGGTGHVSVTFPSTIGITYQMQIINGGSFTSTTVVGDGTSKTLNDTGFDYTTETSFFGYLYKFGSSPNINYGVRIFLTGTASAGSQDLTPFVPPTVTGRVAIAFDDGPLEPNPTWTVLDQGGAFPYNFVASYDIRVGRQTLLSQTDTGTATVTLYDRTGLFDPRNVSSPYYGKLDGRQIVLQLYNPVTTTWEPQFRGLIDDIEWDVDGSAVNASGEPVNETVTLSCVDIFDYLAGYGLTPGLDGVTPPAGAEDGVYYAATAGSVDDRIIEILTDANIDPTMYSVASGNVHVKEVKYDPDESALQALRDAADAELPFLANIYSDRLGRFAFRGRYGRFAPDDVAAEPGSDWDFTRWAVGDGPAIIADPTRAQMRILSFGRARSELVNAAIGFPQGIKPADMPGQVFADTTSITDYGKHSAPPMSDLLCNGGVDSPARPSGTTDLVETALFAELLVKNQKDPRENITAIQLKAMQPDHTPRATATWDLLTRADISHIVNVAVGYPGGTGFTGMATVDDYYIEGRQLHVTPANSGYDYVELDLDVSAAVWSMDTHSVFPDFPG